MQFKEMERAEQEALQTLIQNQRDQRNLTHDEILEKLVEFNPDYSDIDDLEQVIRKIIHKEENYICTSSDFFKAQEMTFQEYINEKHVDLNKVSANDYTVMTVIMWITLIQNYSRDGLRRDQLKDELFKFSKENNWDITQKEMYYIADLIYDDYESPGKFRIKNYDQHEFRKWIKNKKGKNVIDIDLNRTYFLDYTEDMKKAFHALTTFKTPSGGTFLFDDQDLTKIVKNEAQFHGVLATKNLLLDFSKNGHITEKKFYEYCKSSNTRTYERISYIPEQDSDPQTLYIRKHIKPEDNGLLKELIETFTVESDVDRHIIAALIFSAFLGRKFDASIPLFVTVADVQTSGKTAILLFISRLLQGIDPLMFTGDDDDKRKLSGILPMGNRFVLYDNLEKTTHQQMLNITRRCTSGTLPAWFMHISHDDVINNKVPMASFNSQNGFNDDMLERFLPIHMQDGRKIGTKKQADVGRKLRYFVENREKVLANIMWYLKQPRQDVEVLEHKKFTEWSQEMGGILSNVFPDVVEFNFSVSQEDWNLSTEHSMVTEFIEKLMMGKKHRFVTNDELFSQYQMYFKSSSATKRSSTKHIRNAAPSITGYEINYKQMRIDKQQRYYGFEITDLNYEE